MPTFKEVVTTKTYLPFKAMTAGQVVIPDSKYIGRTPNKFGKENFEFEDEKGAISVLNCCGSLELKFEKIEVGSRVRVTYNGKKVISKGQFAGKDFHDFSVAVDVDSQVVAPDVEEEKQENLDLLGL